MLKLASRRALKHRQNLGASLWKCSSWKNTAAHNRQLRIAAAEEMRENAHKVSSSTKVSGLITMGLCSAVPIIWSL